MCFVSCWQAFSIVLISLARRAAFVLLGCIIYVIAIMYIPCENVPLLNFKCYEGLIEKKTLLNLVNPLTKTQLSGTYDHLNTVFLSKKISVSELISNPSHFNPVHFLVKMLFLGLSEKILSLMLLNSPYLIHSPEYNLEKKKKNYIMSIWAVKLL